MNSGSQMYAKLQCTVPDVEIGMRVTIYMPRATLKGEIKDIQYRTLTFNNEDREIYIKLNS